ncbi:hypothetical protein [Streptomyces sp. NPDC058953]|uniref:hypothetical protein n=1 Tax=unclassified Streptomyces TaxID=2593676 RepID=UPI00367A69D9
MGDDELARMRRIVAEYDSVEDAELRSELLDMYGITRDTVIRGRRLIAATERPAPGADARTPRRGGRGRRRHGGRRPAPVGPPGRPTLRRRRTAPRKVVITLRIVVEFL